MRPVSGVDFVKGHGTENDFVLLPDRADALVLTPGFVRAVCDRRAGVGADGLIRIAPDPAGGFLMDYRNADGSMAQMCGNGARLFARFLVDAGWASPGEFTFSTRGGVRTARVPAVGDVGIEMGPVRLGATSSARVGRQDFPGVAAAVGNPHLVCRYDGMADLDLGAAPAVDDALFPDGVNVEFYRPLAPDRVQMRVHERGSGETRSCGTGTVAVAAVHLAALGRDCGTVQVQVPGGLVSVTLASTGGGSPPTAVLTGPAVIVASGTLADDFRGGRQIRWPRPVR